MTVETVCIRRVYTRTTVSLAYLIVRPEHDRLTILRFSLSNSDSQVFHAILRRADHSGSSFENHRLSLLDGRFDVGTMSNWTGDWLKTTDSSLL